TGDNALLKLGPVLDRLASAETSFDITEAAAALLEALGADPSEPDKALEQLAAAEPALVMVVEPMLGVTLVPTMAHASDKINVIPSRAELRVDCRVPPGLGEDAARRRIEQVLGQQNDGIELEFTETVIGNHSPVKTPLMDAITRWISDNDTGAQTLPVLLPGAS